MQLDSVAQDARHPNQAPSRSQEGQGLHFLVVTQQISKPIIFQTASFPDGHPAFPPPSIHPSMTQPQYLPPGSRTVTVDSFNTRSEHIINVVNDKSTKHGTDSFVFPQSSIEFITGFLQYR